MDTPAIRTKGGEGINSNSIEVVLKKTDNYQLRSELVHSLSIQTQRIQLFAKSLTSLAVHSPLGFSFSSTHHSLLPTSGEHPCKANRGNANTTTAEALIIFFHF
jgi:hypothetical protein